MYKLFIVGILFFLLSCQSSQETGEASDTVAKEFTKIDAPPTLSSPQIAASRPPLKQYSDVFTMIEGTGEYYKENGTFKLISPQPLHIQLSKPAYDEDLEEVVREQVKRDIVYVGFRTFAQTNIDEIKITSFPLKMDNNGRKDFDYIQKYKLSATLTRIKAKAILKKYYGHTDFSKLFGEEVSGTYMPEIPNMEIKRMLFNEMGGPTLNKVFAELQ